LACVLADHLCKQGHTVRYFKTTDLILQLKLSKGDGSYPRLRRQLASIDLLVLDEWLRDPLMVQEAREVLDILDERYRQTSCLFVTQMPIEQWHPQIQDPTLADAILDRIIHDAIKVSLQGESMRKLTSKLSDSTAQSPRVAKSKDSKSVQTMEDNE
jgi:DNA replication protein DnaC